jgi:hypothetical protein
MKYVPSVVNCPHCSCFHGAREVMGNLPCMICVTCNTVFMKNNERTILKRGKDIE